MFCSVRSWQIGSKNATADGIWALTPAINKEVEHRQRYGQRRRCPGDSATNRRAYRGAADGAEQPAVPHEPGQHRKSVDDGHCDGSSPAERWVGITGVKARPTSRGCSRCRSPPEPRSRARRHPAKWQRRLLRYGLMNRRSGRSPGSPMGAVLYGHPRARGIKATVGGAADAAPVASISSRRMTSPKPLRRAPARERRIADEHVYATGQWQQPRSEQNRRGRVLAKPGLGPATSTTAKPCAAPRPARPWAPQRRGWAGRPACC